MQGRANGFGASWVIFIGAIAAAGTVSGVIAMLVK